MFNKQQSSAAPSSKGVETIIGPSVKVEGDFKGEGDLIIEGVLIGNIKTKNNLKIGTNAIIQANISANNAFISGKVKGNIHIKGKLELSSTALVLGDVKTQVLSMESGALIKGNIDMPVSNISYQDESPVSKPKSAKETVEEK
ncbi:MAG: polymer-forming cytoskeletal protein [Patescibacteria group bacterium]|nr:polymer-forming cytoskeletal protein [Patescibacteria group bacterium]